MGDDGALAKLPSGGRFFLVLGSLAPNKNMKWVFRSAKRHPDVTYAVAGGAFASAGRTGCGDAPANIVFLGRVSDGEMKSLMERCEALVFPSLDEGFGIPPLEALALGRPVVAARKSCLPEIYGDAVHWFDPDDPDACDDPRELIKSPVSPADEVLTRHVWRNVASGLLSALRGNDAFARAKIWYNMRQTNVSGMKFSHQFLLKRDQILVLIAKDFKLKYNSTALGFLWSLLVPTFTSIVYYFVFGVMMRFDTPNYLLYLMSGTFLWQFFANVIMMNGSVLMSNQGLLKKTSFDRELLVRGTFYTESIHFLLTIPVLLVMMICYDVMPSLLVVVPNLLVLILALMLLSIGVSYFYAACNLYFRDLERIMNIFMMMWMFCSPVFIPVSAVPDKYLWIYNVNPMASILQIWRDIFYVPGWHPQLFLPLVAVCAVIFYIGRLVFKKMEPGFAEMM